MPYWVKCGGQSVYYSCNLLCVCRFPPLSRKCTESKLGSDICWWHEPHNTRGNLLSWKACCSVFTDSRIFKFSKNADNNACIIRKTWNLSGREIQMVRSPNNYPKFVSKETLRVLSFNFISEREKELFLVTQIPSYIDCLNFITE